MLDTDFLGLDPKAPPASASVLSDSNGRGSLAARLSHISASCARRREALRLRQRQEKMRRRRAIRRVEYQRLRCMVPSIAQRRSVPKVTVIEEAIRYIDYLHGALLNRLKTKGLPSCLNGADVDVNHLSLDGIKNLVCQLIEKNNQSKQQASASPADGQPAFLDHSPASVFERSRHVPSYPRPPTIRKRTL